AFVAVDVGRSEAARIGKPVERAGRDHPWIAGLLWLGKLEAQGINRITERDDYGITAAEGAIRIKQVVRVQQSKVRNRQLAHAGVREACRTGADARGICWDGLAFTRDND